MFVDEISTRESLGRMVRKVTANRALREDLLQEGLVHLWITEVSRPGQTRSWYLQSCKYHLLHYLAAGRSVDSGKRRNRQTLFEEDSESGGEMTEEIDSGESVFALVSARDIVELLLPLLNAQEQSVLKCFADGLRLREIGRRLKISHTMVIRHRRKIASLLSRLEKPRPPIIRINGFAHKPHQKVRTAQRKTAAASSCFADVAEVRI
jgi:RNA polymerase sigma factor (sigma-70 family)